MDGFRVDAAKHIPAADLQAIYGRLSGTPYVYQETIEGGAGEVSPAEYTGLGDVTEFRYGDVVGTAFRDGSLSGLSGLPGRMLVAGGDAVAFDGTTTAVSCSSGWACEHRRRTTANLVGLHNTAAGTGVTDWWSNGGSQIAFGRGSAAYVAFNRDGGALTRTFQTSLPAGTYCDVAGSDVSGSTCTGTAYTVNGSGTFTATVPANGMIALHTGARVAGSTAPACTSVAVTFAATATTIWGENVFVLGNRAELSDWNTGGGVALSPAAYPVWRGTVNLPPNTTVEYKYVK